jgi:dienelactone hydrolase
MRNGPDYKGASVYYPTNGEPPYSSIILSPGYFSTQASVADWGPFYASHGIITMTIGTNSLFEDPHSRAAGLLDAMISLKLENTRDGSPLAGQMDVDRIALGGWSMGGGGAQLAATLDASIKAVVAMTPWLSTSSTVPSDLDHAVPVLIFSGQFDPTAPPETHANVHYNYTPGTTDKLKFEVANGDHHVANGPAGAQGDVGKVALSWLQYFMNEDNCYCPLFLEEPPTASSYITNVSCGKVISSSNDAIIHEGAIDIYPNPTKSYLSIEMDILSPLRFDLVNLLGESMLTGLITANRSSIDLSGLSSNIYFLRVEGRSYKVIKTD